MKIAMKVFVVVLFVGALVLSWKLPAGWPRLAADLVVPVTLCAGSWNSYTIPWRNAVNQILQLGGFGLLFTMDSLAVLTGFSRDALNNLMFIFMLALLLSYVVLRKYSGKRAINETATTSERLGDT